MIAVLTSHDYQRHLPLEKLTAAFDKCVFMDTGDPDLSVSITSDSFILRNGSACIDLLQDHCFYYPESFSLHSLRALGEGLPDEQKAIALDSWLAVWEAVEAVSLQTPSRWLNAPCFARPADNKALLSFYDTASHGFSTLKSMTSNDRDRVLRASAGNGFAVKAVSRKEYLGSDALLATQYFAHSELLEFAGDIATCPLLYQPFVVSPRQLRIYVIGNAVLPFEIVSDHSRLKPDVRVANDLDYAIDHAVLPATIIDGIREFVRQDLQLSYVALDFLVEDDKPILIDINPNGVWNWMPANLTNEIDTAFISMLRDHFVGGVD